MLTALAFMALSCSLSPMTTEVPEDVFREIIPQSPPFPGVKNSPERGAILPSFLRDSQVCLSWFPGRRIVANAFNFPPYEMKVKSRRAGIVYTIHMKSTGQLPIISFASHKFIAMLAKHEKIHL
jgi:hypothetical protein